MSLEANLFAALSAITSLQRAGGYIAVSPIIFPQPARYAPEWPAIRYTFIDSVPDVDACGDGDDDVNDVRVQLDIVDTTAAGARSLRLEVRNLMMGFVPPAILQSETQTYDSDEKTFRAIMDYVVTPSSGAGSP